MTNFGDLLHRASHHVPGVPEHTDRPAGHHGGAVHDGATHASANGRWNHSGARPPRFLAGWQRRIGALFSRDV